MNQTDKATNSCELAIQMQASPIDLDIRDAGNLNIGTRNFFPSLSGDDIHFSPAPSPETHPIEFGYMARFDS